MSNHDAHKKDPDLDGYEEIVSRVKHWGRLYPDGFTDAEDVLHEAIVLRIENAGNVESDEPTEESVDKKKFGLWKSLFNGIRNKKRKSTSQSPRRIPYDKVDHDVEIENVLSVAPAQEEFIDKENRLEQLRFIRCSGQFSDKESLLMVLTFIDKIRDPKDLFDEMKKVFPLLSYDNFRQLRHRLQQKLKQFPRQLKNKK